MCSLKRAHCGEGVALLDEELVQLGAADVGDLPRGEGRVFIVENGCSVALYHSKKLTATSASGFFCAKCVCVLLIKNIG
jgi:hypothetical protein